MSLRRSFVRTFCTIAKALPTAIAVSALALSSLAPAQAPSYGPLMPPNGFPSHYTDGQGTALSLCLANPAMCLLAEPLAEPIPGVAFPANYSGTFPDESFYWAAEATMPTAGGGQALLVLALEASFSSGIVLPGDQTTFARMRLRIDNLVAGATYRITHPYGQVDLVATGSGRRAINYTEDLGLVPGNFSLALGGNIFPFLRWDSGLPLLDVQGNEYVGDPNIPHTVTGSPTGTNYFRIEGPNVGGPGISLVQTNFFHVLGMVQQPAPLPTFTASVARGPAPLSVAFQNQSSGSITSHQWNFGNGQTSNLVNPTCIYTTPGLYTVSLTVTGPGGTQTRTLPDMIRVDAPPPVLSLLHCDGSGQRAHFRVTGASTGCKPMLIGASGSGTSRFRCGSVDFVTGLSRPVDERARLSVVSGGLELDVRAPNAMPGARRYYQLLDPVSGQASNVVVVTL
ncbi:MAG: PKD domain-containing protein [Planctomycetota bacterium]